MGQGGVMKITGQLMLRETNQEIDGRKVYTVFGLIAPGKGETLTLEGEHQYDVVGMEVMGDLRLHIVQASAIDRTELAKRGHTPNQLLCSPIWRI